MKRILLLAILAAITSLSVSAQSKTYKGFVEGGYGAFVGSKTGSALSFTTSHGKMFGPVFVGAGIGLEHMWIKNESYVEGYISESGWDGWIGLKKFTGVSVPVFVNVKGIWDKKKVSPTFDVKCGLSIGEALGLLGEVGAGCRFDLGKTALLTTAFIKSVNEPENMVTDDPPYLDERFTLAGFKIAWEF